MRRRNLPQIQNLCLPRYLGGYWYWGLFVALLLAQLSTPNSQFPFALARRTGEGGRRPGEGHGRAGRGIKGEVSLFLILILLLIVPTSRAADIVWTNTAGGNWGTAANWNPNQVPGSADNAFITNSGTYTVTVSANASVASFNLGGSSGTQSLTVSGGTFTNNGASTSSANGVLNLSGGTLSGGTVNLSGGTTLITSSSGGTLNNVAVNGDLTLAASSARVIIAGTTSFQNAHLSGNSSALGFAPGTTLSGNVLFEGANTGNRFVEMSGSSGTFTIGPGGSIKMVAGFGGSGQVGPVNFFGGSMTLINNGLISAEASGRTLTLSPASFTNNGRVESRNGSLMSITSPYIQTAGLTLLEGGNLTVSQPFQLQGGTFAGTNTLTGSVTNNGLVSPGVSPGRLTITGNYTQTTNGALLIELAGTSPGTNFDRLAVSGVATLAGALNVTLTNGFYPATNAAFTFLTNASRSGTFATFNYPSNDVGMQLSYAATNTTIQVINVRPVLVFSNQTIDELALFNFNGAGTDDDLPPQTLTYALINSPIGATINSSSGLISWTPTEAQGPLTTNITVLVTDNGTPNLTVSRTFQIVVNEINVAPELTLPPNQTFNEQTAFNASATATDSDIPVNTLTFELVSGPAGLTVATNGAIAWQPTEAQGPNAYPVTVRVTDNNTNAVNPQQLSTTNSFTLTVNEVNLPPVLTVPTNQVLIEETTLSVSASATDPDFPANGLSFALLSPPGGMTINSGSGAISWTPDETQGSNFYTINVVVTDDNPAAINSQHLSVTNSFTVTVNESNRPPVLTVPSTQTITEENPLTGVFASATDPDSPANPLSFALISPPEGMTINANSGAIAWTPTEAQGSTFIRSPSLSAIPTRRRSTPSN